MKPVFLWHAAVGVMIVVSSMVGAPLRAFGAAVWTPHNDGVSGASIVGLVIDPTATSTLYALTSSSGVYKSTDGGTSWIAVNSGLPVNKAVQAGHLFGNLLTMDPQDPTVLYSNFGGNIFMSTTSAASWAQRDTGIALCGTLPVSVGVAIDPTDSNHLLAGDIATACTGGIYESHNTGATWSHVTTTGAINNDSWILAFDPNNSSIIYSATVHVGFIRSTDGGASWTQNTPPGASDTGSALAAVSPAGSTVVFYGNDAGLYRSTDHGVTWVSKTASVPGTVFDIKFSSSDPLTGYVASAAGVYKTTDGGVIWTEVGSHGGKSPRTLAVNPVDPSIVYLGSSGSGMYKSTDGGVTFNAINTGIPVNINVAALAVAPSDSSVYYAAVNGLGFFKSTDRATSWISMSTAYPEVNHSIYILVDPVDSNTIYAGFEKVYKSTDGGTTFSVLFDPGGTRYFQAAAIDPLDRTHLLVADNATFAMFSSRDSGATWATSTSLTTGNYIFRLVFDDQDSSKAYAATYSAFWKSADNGDTWTQSTDNLAGDDAKLDAVAFLSPAGSPLYIGTRGGHVFKSSDGGDTWTATSYTPATPGDSANKIIVDPSGTLYAFTLHDWQSSTDEGDTWTPQPTTGLTSPFFQFQYTAVIDPTDPARFVSGDFFNGIHVFENFEPDFSASTLTAVDADSGLILSGDRMDYTVTIPNTGNADATGVEAVYALPANEVFVAGSAKIDGASIADPLTGGILTFSLGTIEAGVTTTVTFSATVFGDVPSHTAVITSDSDPTGVQTSDVSIDVEEQTVVLPGPGPFTPPSGYIFDTTRSYPLGGSVQGTIAVADMNGDGYSDAVVPSGSDAILLMNNGDGVFSTSSIFAVGPNPQSILIKDLNADGALDIAGINRTANTVFVVLNQGGNTFAPRVTYTVGTNPRSIVTADINHDGTPDLVVAAASAGAVDVLLGNGSGAFGSVTAYSVPGVIAVAAGDWNGDSFDDVAATTFNNQLHILRNTNGTLSDVVSYAIGGGNRANTVAADVNHDGWIDIIVPSENNNTFSVFLNVGTGSIGFTAASYYVPNKTQILTVTDMDADGYPDVVTANKDVPSVSVFHNTGSGAFILNGTYPLPGASFVQAADVDRNGSPDLLVTSVSSLSVLLNPGDSFFHQSESIASNGGAAGFFVHDLNGDGVDDVAVANTNDATLAILLGGSESLTAHASYPTDGGAVNVTGGDLNDDNNTDLAVTTANGAVMIFLGDGTGSFATSTSLSATGPIQSVVGDFNEDGKQDLFVLDSDAFTATIWQGLGDGTFGTSTAYAAGDGNIGSPIWAVVADFNDDHYLDFAFTTPAGITVYLASSTTAGTFTGSADYNAGISPGKFVVHDLNEDGHVDFLVSASPINFLEGDGDGSFTTAATYDPGINVQSLAIGDFDLDGFDDLLSGSQQTGQISILYGDGAGNLGSSDIYQASSTANDVASGRMTGDLRRDVVVADGNGVSFLKGIRAGLRFSTTTLSLPSGAPVTYAARLSVRPIGPVTVTITSPSIASITPSTLVFTPANWNQPQIVSVTRISPGSGLISHSITSGLDSDYDALAGPGISVSISGSVGNGTGSGGSSLAFSGAAFVPPKIAPPIPRANGGNGNSAPSSTPDKVQTPPAIFFTRNFGIGSRGEDVQRLQQFLNQHGFKLATTGPGSPGNETTVFAARTAAALKKYQEANVAIVLRPYGLVRGTGYFGSLTRALINKTLSENK